ncbi:nuclear RNA export factor 1-like isoform X2 [Clupea harengus]|uniref:Nuclear RNA export factor 1 n=1 Tax=Clupea harengus TaxID=7950 RepID=A0A6P3VS32_CLUHA|nr:nuclear RNA export factor 1-like isoform X2 [Clupea harengus]
MAAADDSRYYNEHDDRVGGPQFRNRKGRGPFRARMHSEHQGPRQRHRGGPGGFGPNPRTRFEDDDGDVPMGDGVQDGSSQRRYNPYGRPGRRGDGRFDRDRKGSGGPGHRGGGASGGGGERGGGAAAGGKKGWFKIIIPYGKKYDKKWLLSALQNLCPVPFTPVKFSTEGHRAQFYIEDSSTANALQKISRKITDMEGYKVIVISNPCAPPLTDLKPEEMDSLKQCMSKRFDGSQQALDLNSIRTDPDLVSQNTDIILNRKHCMHAVLKIIEENIPELVSLNLGSNKLYKLDDMAELASKAPNLKILNLSHNELRSERELDKVKGLKLVELWLDHNPLCDYFKDQPNYISAIRERFPRLLKLDGHDLPPPIVFDVEAPTVIPPCKGSYFGSDDIKILILRFLQQYFSVYDSGDRQPLLDAYHDGASFSLSMPFSAQNPARCSLGEYHKDSRNLKRLKDPTTRFRLLKHTRLNVVAFLNELPKTQHDTACFNVDVNTYTNTLLSFTVTGVFKEVDGKSRDSVRAFSRVFIAVPAGNTGLCIVNDELFVRNATTEEIRRAFAAPAPTPSSSPVPTLTAPQQEMLNTFSLKSGMNLEWSQKCLLDMEWDFDKAAHVFTQMKAQGKIPDVAFIK